MIKPKTQQIRKARIEQGYNQSDICTAINMNITSYNQIENGKTGPRPKTAKKICDFLKKSFDDLFELVEEN